MTWVPSSLTPHGMSQRVEGVFWAAAICPKGRYVAGVSEEFVRNSVSRNTARPVSYDIDTNQALEDLILKLTNDGWMYVGSYDNWFWCRRFRR